MTRSVSALYACAPLACAMTTGLEARHPVLAGVHISGFHDRWPFARSKFGHGEQRTRQLADVVRPHSCCFVLPRSTTAEGLFCGQIAAEQSPFILSISYRLTRPLPPAGPLPTVLHHRKVGSLRGDVNAEGRRSTRAGGGGAIGARCVNGVDVLSVGRGGGQEAQCFVVKQWIC